MVASESIGENTRVNWNDINEQNSSQDLLKLFEVKACELKASIEEINELMEDINLSIQNIVKKTDTVKARVKTATGILF